MDLRLEAEGGTSAIPKDCYLAIRVGDARHQARYDPSRPFHFPEEAEKHIYGRIDLFKRVASSRVNVDATVEGPRNVVLSCSDGLGKVNLKVDLQKTTKGKADSRKSNKSIFNEQMLENKKYVSKSGLEVFLAGIMKAAMREKPTNPRKWLVEYLSKEEQNELKLPPINSGYQPPVATGEMGTAMPPKSFSTPSLASQPVERPNSRAGQKLPPLKEGAAPSKPASEIQGAQPIAKVEPIKVEPIAKPVKAQILPFKEYYQTHVQSCKQEYYDNGLYQKFSGFQTAHALVKDAIPVQAFSFKPSVGTWLSPSIPGMPTAIEDGTSAQGSFNHKPSVGTWLQPIPLEQSEGEKSLPV